MTEQPDGRSEFRAQCTHLRTGWARGRPCISIERDRKTYRCIRGPGVPAGINSLTGIWVRPDGGWRNDISSTIIGKPVGDVSTVRLESNLPIWISIIRDKLHTRYWCRVFLTVQFAIRYLHRWLLFRRWLFIVECACRSW